MYTIRCYKWFGYTVIATVTDLLETASAETEKMFMFRWQMNIPVANFVSRYKLEVIYYSNVRMIQSL